MRGNSLGGYSNFGAQTAIICSGFLVLSDKELTSQSVEKATQLFALCLVRAVIRAVLSRLVRMARGKFNTALLLTAFSIPLAIVVTAVAYKQPKYASTSSTIDPIFPFCVVLVCRTRRSVFTRLP